MKQTGLRAALYLLLPFVFAACTSTSYVGGGDDYDQPNNDMPNPPPANYESRIPQRLETGEKTVLIDPNVHTWGAYNSDGELVKAGVASAGSDWCSDLGRSCHTRSGSFRIYSLGSPNCISHKFPIPRGGAPMPYCMFFSGGQALHGVPSHEVGDGNYSHGCVRMQVVDAEWLRYNFADVGTKVIVKPY